MMPTDLAAPASGTLRRLSDRRVRQYWDPQHRLAAQMMSDARPPQPEQDCCVLEGVLWDLAAVYPPGSLWSERMPPATVFNGPVVDVIETVEAALGAGPPVGAGPSAGAIGSAARPPGEPGGKPLVLLTRGECAMASIMRRNLDDALEPLRPPLGYDIVDLDTLPEADVRRGYPTPTLLYNGTDVFGMPAPEAPVRHPT